MLLSGDKNYLKCKQSDSVPLPLNDAHAGNEDE